MLNKPRYGTVRWVATDPCNTVYVLFLPRACGGLEKNLKLRHVHFDMLTPFLRAVDWGICSSQNAEGIVAQKFLVLGCN